MIREVLINDIEFFSGNKSITMLCLRIIESDKIDLFIIQKI